MPKILLAIVFSMLFSTTTFADSQENQADHEALRKLKTDVISAVNNRDYATMQKVMHQPFMATMITQDNFTDFGKLKNFFESHFTRDVRRMKKISIAAEADDLSQIYQGTFALTKGSTKEHYELTDGRIFDMDGRWTAVSIKDNGQWKLLAIHTGTNFLDNPVLNAIEKSTIWFAVGGAGGGLIVGFLVGWFFRKNRAGKSGA